MDKTVVVAVETLVRHLYQRIVRRTKKFKAHDEKNACRNGDKVKRWRPGPFPRKNAGGHRNTGKSRTNISVRVRSEARAHFNILLPLRK